MFLAVYGFLNSTSPPGGSDVGSCTNPSGLAPNHGLVTGTTNPHLLMDMLGEDSLLILRYPLLLSSSRKIPQLVAELP